MITDTTPARRALLALLLDRVDRDALLAVERPLLRALVAAEQRSADLAETVTIQARADQATLYRLRQAVREARAAALPHSELDGFVQQMTAALDTPSDDEQPAGHRYWRANDQAEMHDRYMAMLAATTRVRALHRKATDGETCVYCAHGQRLGYDTTWPCDTIRALDDPAACPGCGHPQHTPGGCTGQHHGYDCNCTEGPPADTLPPGDDEARPWIAEALSLDPDTSWGVLADSARSTLHYLAAANDTLSRVRELAERWQYVPGLKDSPRTSLLRALDGPSPTADAGPQVLHVTTRDTDCATTTDDDTEDDPDEDDEPPCWHTEPGTTCDWNICRQPARLAAGDRGTDPAHGLSTPNLDALRAGQPITMGTPTDWANSVDEQCPAHYTGESPQLTQPAWQPVDYRCERRGHGPDTNHAARLAQGSGTVVFCWTDAIALYPYDPDAAAEHEAQHLDAGRQAEATGTDAPSEPQQ